MGKADQAERRLRSRQTEWRALQTASITPTAAVAEGLAQRVAQAEYTAKTLRERLGATEQDEVYATPAPAQRADAFFVIAQFVEAQRQQAKKAGVRIPGNFAFSFSAYANSGPEMAQLAVVHRQQLLVEQLLKSLWLAQPLELTSLQREDPARKLPPPHGAQAPASRGGRGDDYFEFPPDRSAQRDEIADTLALRIGFVGRTDTLRRYLAAIAEIELPLMVREIEVEPLGADGRASGGARSLADLFRDDQPHEDDAEDDLNAAIPIIAANDAEFLVTIEYLDFRSPRVASMTTGEELP